MDKDAHIDWTALSSAALKAAERLAAAIIAAEEILATLLDSLGEEVLKLSEAILQHVEACFEIDSAPPPRPPLQILHQSPETRQRTLRELYGQGLDAGPGRPSWAEPPS